MRKSDNNNLPEKVKREIENSDVGHRMPEESKRFGSDLSSHIYSPDDFSVLQAIEPPSPHYRTIKSLDELLERDEQRNKDGFKRKINIGKIIKPGRAGSKKIIIVPTTTEDKFYHDSRVSEENENHEDSRDSDSDETETGESAGTAEGEVGDVIGERPLTPEGEGEGTGAGSGSGGEHEIGASAYELGKVLTEKFKLPNLKDKGARKTVIRYNYELTDMNRKHGQVLDKRKTLMEIIKTNINLNRFDPDMPPKPENFIINPRDFMYRVLSKEKEYESQAIVFFVRDYSGSMHGKPTEAICSQHVMIYSWLMYQYQEQVMTRFILHDTEAKEVPDFYSYYNLNVAGGTKIQSAVDLVNEIVEKENLAANYNIYIFYGGDGDDWSPDKNLFDEAFSKLFSYVNRMGITIVRNSYMAQDKLTDFELFLKERSILEKHKDLIELDVISEDADDKRLVEGIRNLVS
ncbi:MAG: hypothetical protein A2020_08720 [Lentisphaerae bacterium GWF2_45_14]|nr:MAG: hypothetical protein A2020_08720 [Lentisphaerae bacterium GWF2_45_14]